MTTTEPQQADQAPLPDMPSPVRRVSPLQDAVERLSDYAATGIEPTGDVRDMIGRVLHALSNCRQHADALTREGRELLWSIEPLLVQGEAPHVERFGLAISSFRGAVR